MKNTSNNNINDYISEKRYIKTFINSSKMIKRNITSSIPTRKISRSKKNNENSSGLENIIYKDIDDFNKQILSGMLIDKSIGKENHKIGIKLPKIKLRKKGTSNKSYRINNPHRSRRKKNDDGNKINPRINSNIF